MEPPIVEITAKIQILLNNLSELCDAHQSERVALNNFCKDIRIFIKTKQKSEETIHINKKTEINPSLNQRIKSQNQPTAVNSSIKGIKKIKYPEIQGSHVKTSRASNDIRKSIKKSQSLSTKVVSVDEGAIPKIKNTFEMLKPDMKEVSISPSKKKFSALKKVLDVHESTVKLVKSCISHEMKLSGQHAFMARLGINSKLDDTHNRCLIKEDLNYAYDMLEQVINYSQLGHIIWCGQLDLLIYHVLVDFALHQLQMMTIHDEFFIHVVRCIMMLLKDDNFTLPVFIRDNV